MTIVQKRANKEALILLEKNKLTNSIPENVLKQLLIRTAGLLPNQKNKMFLGFDLRKIKDGIKNRT